MTGKKNKIENSSKGFTLIEMLVVVFVIGIGLVGALSFFNININNQFEAKNELIAAGLAQESSDLVRNFVDYNYLNLTTTGSWYNEITEIDAPSNINKYCSSIDREILSGVDKFKCKSKLKKSILVCFNSSGGYYHQAKNGGKCETGENETNFTRWLTISGEDANNSGGAINLDDGDCIKVVATVAWSGRETISTDIICKPRE